MLRTIALASLLLLPGCAHVADRALATALPRLDDDTATFYMMAALVILAGYGIHRAAE